MEAKKGFLALLAIIGACLALAAAAGVIGWNWIGRRFFAEWNPYGGFSGASVLEIEKSEMERYFSDHQIACTPDAASVDGFTTQTCVGAGDLSFQVFYAGKSTKPYSILARFSEGADTGPDSEAGRLMEIITGIPYAGADPAAARDWLRACLAIDGYDSFLISKSISGAVFTLYDSVPGDLVFSVTVRTEAGGGGDFD
jgi:hypothetical protein